MMNTDNVTALVPVRSMIEPVSALGRREIAHYRYRDRPRGGLRFLGYGPVRGDLVYGPSGRRTKGRVMSGGMVDVYV
jgi:hypothetical protein